MKSLLLIKKKKKYHHLKPSSLERRETPAAPDCLKMQIRHNSAAEIGPAGLSHRQRLAADNHRAPTTAANASKRHSAPPPFWSHLWIKRMHEAAEADGRVPRCCLFWPAGGAPLFQHTTHTHTQSGVHRFPSGGPQGRGRSPHMTSQFTGVWLQTAKERKKKASYGIWRVLRARVSAAASTAEELMAEKRRLESSLKGQVVVRQHRGYRGWMLLYLLHPVRCLKFHRRCGKNKTKTRCCRRTFWHFCCFIITTIINSPERRHGRQKTGSLNLFFRSQCDGLSLAGCDFVTH